MLTRMISRTLRCRYPSSDFQYVIQMELKQLESLKKQEDFTFIITFI